MQTSPPHGRRTGPILHRPAAGALAALILAAAALSLAGCGKKAESYAAPPTPTNVTLTAAQLQHVQLYTVAPSSFHKSVEAAGVVDFDNDQATSVIAPISGPVTKLLVEPGQKVRAGDTLALVDSPDYSAAISAYAKALATAKTDRQLAGADKDLAQHNGVSQREAAQAQTDAANAEADRDAALQALVALNLDPAIIKQVQQGHPMARVTGKIRSPIAGTVVEKLITPGQLLQAGTTPAFTVANLSKVWVMAQVPATDLPTIAVGDPVEVQTGVGAAALTGTVDNIAALVNPDTRAVQARVVVENPQGLLKKQMYVRVQIHSRQTSTGFLVPVSAILRDDENLPFVYVAQAGGGFARRHVTLGYRSGDQYDIPTGLQAGDRIVVDGGIFVQFMQSQ
ncbi:MAG TPA: efflux RND transporter periplasmic adaptor subunit [Phenylobacterium sp.]|jgi:cobalt-zinc-cadmium efflux system membrane fusion protein|uniref:efflux RND transporter periplasmic adaptor subunit n=1 Tax=Phenylobacterium sp. TaxID=1871053 RepID=UPI002D310EEB|nr:efflux RND transporter periplasmic adaptor subunit [Phenylobacterium sp.]HZZ69026.1 efflux RND transporter periplasmic adaptor subunit [Phenylobacterium sp.]